MLEGDLSNLSPGAKIRAHHGGLEEGFHQLPWGFGIPRVSRPQNLSNPLLLFGPLPQCLVWFIQWLWQVKKNLIKSVFVWPFEWMPLSMQVENDLNFSVLLQYLASFAHDLPQPLEVKAGWNRSCLRLDRLWKITWCDFMVIDFVFLPSLHSTFKLCTFPFSPRSWQHWPIWSIWLTSTRKLDLIIVCFISWLSDTLPRVCPANMNRMASVHACRRHWPGPLSTTVWTHGKSSSFTRPCSVFRFTVTMSHDCFADNQKPNKPDQCK